MCVSVSCFSISFILIILLINQVINIIYLQSNRHDHHMLLTDGQTVAGMKCLMFFIFSILPVDKRFFYKFIIFFHVFELYH